MKSNAIQGEEGKEKYLIFSINVTYYSKHMSQWMGKITVSLAKSISWLESIIDLMVYTQVYNLLQTQMI